MNPIKLHYPSFLEDMQVSLMLNIISKNSIIDIYPIFALSI
jgi:hypothetical protein